MILAKARVVSAMECTDEALNGISLELGHMLVQVISTNDMYNLMPILIPDATNDIILLCDVVTKDRKSTRLNSSHAQ